MGAKFNGRAGPNTTIFSLELIPVSFCESAGIESLVWPKQYLFDIQQPILGCQGDFGLTNDRS
jgi:hypothetical protein